MLGTDSIHQPIETVLSKHHCREGIVYLVKVHEIA